MDNNKIKTIIMASSREDFFASGREIAKAVDEGDLLVKRRVISFEDIKYLKAFIEGCFFSKIDPKLKPCF